MNARLKKSMPQKLPDFLAGCRPEPRIGDT